MKNNHILLIDDDPAIQRLFGAKFASAGFEVMYAHDGDSGREMARRFMPAVILLDIRMPVTDGYTIARRLKTEPKTKDIPIIFLTNEDFTPEAEKAAKEVWVSDYVHKSMDLDEIVKRVKKVITDFKR
ncbi:MAG: two-component response regulator [Parcubacteria group bacterium Gr01-1014_29]|nr:MAG: two-component response regulator [Parcubacteria group bacterium Gr01-1014_29]